MAKKLSRKDLLQAIHKLEENPDDRVRILSEAGIAGAGAVGAGAVAAIVGASVAPVPVITALTGATVAVAASPFLIAGAAVAGGIAAYGAVKLATGGAAQEAKRDEIKKRLIEELHNLEIKSRTASLTATNKNKFVIFLKVPLEQNLITAEQAQQLIEFVEAGKISLEDAYRLLKNILNDQNEDGRSTLAKA